MIMPLDDIHGPPLKSPQTVHTNQHYAKHPKHDRPTYLQPIVTIGLLTAYSYYREKGLVIPSFDMKDIQLIPGTN